MLKGIGESSIKQMSKDWNIKTFQDVLSFDVEKHNFEKKQKLKSQIEKLTKIVEHNCNNGNRPEPTNNMNAENPYESKYGDDWREKIELLEKMNNYVCITTLIKHIYEESRRIMEVRFMSMTGISIMTHCL